MRIAMIGQRGVPATWGGVEHHVEELGARLADRGHEVTVYCRTNYTTDHLASYRGMQLRHLRTVDTKHFDAISHSAASTVAALRSRPDIVHYHALGPGLLSPAPRWLSRTKVVQTIHGLDHQREKWARPGATVLRLGGWLSARVPHATIVVSNALAAHYRDEYRRATTYVANGVVAPPPPPDASILADRWGLEPRSYLLFVGRLVPEKAPDLLLRAFRRLPGHMRLVIAGGSSFTEGYCEVLEDLAAADPRVVLTGYVYGDELEALYAHAAAFVLPSSLEGLPLTLLEAAARAVPIIASDIAPHAEVLKESTPEHRLFPSGDEDALTAALADFPARNGSEPRSTELAQRVLREYNWDEAAAATERVYADLLA